MTPPAVPAVTHELGSGAATIATGLTLDDGLDFDAWAEVGQRIGRIANASAWWIGDWVNYGEREYGAKYRQAIEATGFAYQTLVNIANVCKRVEINRRRLHLSFGHHAEIAALPRAEQERWLDRAERKALSVMALREAVRASHRLPSAPADTLRRLVFAVPEERASRWEQAAEKAGREFEEWAADVLDETATRALMLDDAAAA